MALAIREQILAALYATLDPTPPLATVAGSVTAYRNRRKELSPGSLPALVQLDGGQPPPDDTTSGVTLYELDLEIEGHVATATEALLGPALSDLYAVALQAVMADRTLGGLAIDIHEGALAVDLDRGEGKAPAGAFLLALRIEFWSRPGAPYAAGP